MNKLNSLLKTFKKRYFSNSSYTPLSYCSQEEGDKIYIDSFLKAFTFIKMNQIKGEIAEFGTFMGYTARILANLMKENNYLVPLG